MSTLRTPVGPQPPRVYWRRRLMVGLGLLAVIIVIVLIVVRPGSADDTPAADVSASPSAQAESDPAADDAAAEQEGAACRPANVTIEAVTDKEAYAAGELPQLTMRLTNVGSAACTLNVTPTQQIFEVGSGEEAYWLSSDCQAEAAEAIVTLEPNAPQSTTPIVWDRTRSAPCDASTELVPAADATYYLQVRLGELESGKRPFRLL